MTRTEAELNPAGHLDPRDIAGHADLADEPDLAAEPTEPTEPLSALDELAQDLADAKAKGDVLYCPIPGYGLDLIGKFTLLTKAEKTALARQINNVPHGLSKEHQHIRKMALRIAAHCRELKYKERVIEGDTSITGGFTHDFGVKLQARPIEGGTREPDVADTVWAVLKRNDESIVALLRVLMKFVANPTFTDLSDADPFVSF